jgi:hypothetical protein
VTKLLHSTEDFPDEAAGLAGFRHGGGGTLDQRLLQGAGAILVADVDKLLKEAA